MSIQYPLNNFNNKRLIVACAINRADKPLTSYFGLHANTNNSHSVAFKYLFWILDYFISYQDKSQAVLYSDGAFTHFLCLWCYKLSSALYNFYFEMLGITVIHSLTTVFV